MEYIIALLVFIGLVLARFIGSLAASEFRDYCDVWAASIVRFAAQRLPLDARARYTEEWQAHVNDCPGKLGKLRHAVGVLWSARTIEIAGRSNRDSVLRRVERAMAREPGSLVLAMIVGGVLGALDLSWSFSLFVGIAVSLAIGIYLFRRGHFRHESSLSKE